MITPGKVEIRIGLGTCGVASGGRAVERAVRDSLRQLSAEADVKSVGCAGLCHQEPLIIIVDREGRDWMYGNLKPAAVDKLIRRHLAPEGFSLRVRAAVRDAGRWLTRDDAWEHAEDYEIQSDRGPVGSYIQTQKKVVLEHCGNVNPMEIGDYLAVGGYEGLRRALHEMTPEQVIEVVCESGLRGRGGAGFGAGRKWGMARQAPGAKKYVITNGDEGDPGAFMDRLILESDPHRVIEGLAVAAYAIGADEGILYVRSEYPLAVKTVRHAIAQAEERGWLGEGVQGTKFNLKLSVFEGAGAFVCGEETALIASIEGKRGMPRLRPPYPAQSGLNGRPTLVNNVETLACVPWILREGADAFAAMGTAGSPGTKVFALAGKIRYGGLIEVPMGITIREVVEKVGGGIPGDRPFKAVQIGGPAGGCIPVEHADTPIDFEELNRLGAIMGSGGLVVLDDTDCMVDIARFFLEFTQLESCGRCVFCRVGTKRMVETLDRLCEGHGSAADLEELRNLGEQVCRTSLCGLGQNAANPVLTAMQYFPEEYEAHTQGRCPAGHCKPLIKYYINEDCIGCTRCAQRCPTDAIAPKPYERHEVDDEKCVRCNMCKVVCPADAVEVKH